MECSRVWGSGNWPRGFLTEWRKAELMGLAAVGIARVSRDFFDQQILGAVHHGPGIHGFGNGGGVVNALALAGRIDRNCRKEHRRLADQYQFVVAERFESAQVSRAAEQLRESFDGGHTRQTFHGIDVESFPLGPKQLLPTPEAAIDDKLVLRFGVL